MQHLYDSGERLVAALMNVVIEANYRGRRGYYKCDGAGVQFYTADR